MSRHGLPRYQQLSVLSQGSKPHNHTPDNLIEEKSTFFSSLKRKAADQRITATQNIYSVCGSSFPTSTQSQSLGLSRGVGQSHLDPLTQESSDAKLFVLPPNCLTTANNDNFVLFDGEAPNGTRMIVFSTTRNLYTLADYPNWIGDGTFYILYPAATKPWSYSYIIYCCSTCTGAQI